LVLLLVGVVLLAQTAGYFPSAGEAVLGLLVASGGVGLVAASLTRRLGWWGTVGGASLAGVGAVIVVEAVRPGAESQWAASIVLGSIGAGFLVAYLVLHTRWWMLIPAGTLLTLALAAGVGPLLPADLGGAVYMFGLAATFAAVAAAGAPGKRSWALIPAGVFALLGLATISSSGRAGFVLPVLIIAAGVYLLVRSARRPGSASRP
jgi:hypothetical protein